ncbi:hypothetical protein SLE2022_320460 [Rubroshorea leprosula]
MPPIPKQFNQLFFGAFGDRILEQLLGFSPWQEEELIIPRTVCTVGALKCFLVGPPMTRYKQECCATLMGKGGVRKMLRIIEIQLSLLYDLLHTKLPVVDSKIGYVCRIVNFVCILGALVSFSILLEKDYQNKLGEFDICLTYGLLIGALALDLISIWSLMSSSWFVIRQYSDKKNYDEFIEGHQYWSNSVPQLNIFSHRLKHKDGDYRNKLVDFLATRFETIRRIQCGSLQNFVEEQAWELFFTTVQDKASGEAGMNIVGPSTILTNHFNDFSWTFNKFEYMEGLLIWHIATEICYQEGCPYNSSNSSFTSTSNDPFRFRLICKLISDYMFYLLVVEPIMITSSLNHLKISVTASVSEATDPYGKWKWPSYWEKGSKETFTQDLKRLLEEEDENAYIDPDLLKEKVDKLHFFQKAQISRISRIAAARLLAKELLNWPNGCPWNLMAKFWVEMVC